MKINLKELTLYSLLGAVMYISKILLEFLPNVHLLGVLTVAYTVVFRKKALYPIYAFVLIIGVLNGFSVWWVPYLYLWTVLWGAAMLVPRFKNKYVYATILAVVCSLHGFLYGTLYAPFQAIAFGLDFKGTIAWIIAGLPWDAVHGVSNLFLGALIMPAVRVLEKAKKITT